MDNFICATGIHHVALHCRDFAVSHKFYTEGLGLREFKRWQSGERTVALLEIANGSYLELFSHGNVRSFEDTQAGMYVHLALRVTDSRAAFRRALEAGAREKIAPKQVLLGAEDPLPATISFVCGPDGEEIEFFQV